MVLDVTTLEVSNGSFKKKENNELSVYNPCPYGHPNEFWENR